MNSDENSIFSEKLHFNKITERNLSQRENYFNTDENYRNKYSKIRLDSNNSNIENGNLYSLSSNFFNDCRNLLKKNEYNDLIDTLKSFNTNELDKIKAFRKIEIILKSYEELSRNFKIIFSETKN